MRRRPFLQRISLASLSALLPRFDIVHVTGAGHLQPELTQEGYHQKSFIGDEFGDVLAASTLVVSRAGANSLYEMFWLGLPHLLIPLTRAASRGDQLSNAEVFRERGYSRVLYEHELDQAAFVEGVNSVYEARDQIREKLSSFNRVDSVALLTGMIQESV